MFSGANTIADHDLAEVTDDHLDQILARTQAMIDRCRMMQMRVLSEKDRRQAHTGDGYRTLHEWAAARLDETPETARALVNTARSIPDDIASALEDGEIGFARAAQTTRLARAGVDDALETGWAFDIAGLRRRVSDQHPISTADERDVFDRRHVVLQPNLDESSWRLFGLLPGVDGAIVAHALHTRADTFPTNRDARAQRRADALTSIALDTLTTSDGDPVSNGPANLISVFVDAPIAAPASGQRGVRLQGGPRIGVHALEGILCDGIVEVIGDPTDGRTIDHGASTVIPPRLRRKALARDGGSCVIDGCQSRYRIEVHHLQPRHLGGDHSLDNLASLCWYHHHVAIHGHGHTIDPHTPPHRRRLHRPPANGPPV